mgnify:CR=1 FL=1
MECKDRLKALRQEREWSQSYVAEKIGIKKGTYSTYETGRCELNGLTITALTRLYNVSADYLLGLTDDREISRIDKLQEQAQELSSADVDEVIQYIAYLKWRADK